MAAESHRKWPYQPQEAALRVRDAGRPRYFGEITTAAMRALTAQLATRPVKAPPASELDAWCDEYLARLRAYAMPSRTRATDRAVLAALCHRCRLDQSRTCRASERELAELANKSKNAVSAALDRLAVADPFEGRPAFITRTREEQADAGGAGRYTLLLDALPPLADKSEGAASSRAARLPVAALATGDRSHDALAPKRRCPTDTEADHRAADSISASAHDVWAWLLDHPDARPADIQEGMGASAATVSRALRSLESLRMAVNHGTPRRGCWRATHEVACDRDLDPIALHAGTVGRTAKKKARHVRERAAYEQQQTEREEARRARAAEEAAREAERATWSAERRAEWEAAREAEHDAALANLRARREAERRRRSEATWEEPTTLADLGLEE